MSNPLRIQLAHSPADAALISQVFDEVWSVKTMVSPEIIVASLHNGAYGSVVWDGDLPVAAAFAIVGKSLTEQASELNLHSHAAGVVQSHAGQGIGAQLKMHQWQWARENDFATITTKTFMANLMMESMPANKAIECWCVGRCWRQANRSRWKW
jgi:predicted GNAT superfamily acetyltransferase